LKYFVDIMNLRKKAKKQKKILFLASPTNNEAKKQSPKNN